MAELSLLVIEVQSIFGSDMHRHFAGDQARLIFGAQDLQR